MSNYINKIALVTGSSRGVGRQIAQYFIDSGATVIGFSRGEGSITHDRYNHIKVDLGDIQDIQSAFSTVRKLVSSIDIVINNAAVLTSQYAMVIPPGAVQSMINVNLVAPFMVSREAAKLMRKNQWGRIINIGSMAASLEPKGDSIYAACKAGLSTLANVMAKEFSHMNVTCNTLGITAIESDMLSQLPRDKIDAIIATLPVPRFATIEDILNVIDFFAAEPSAYITAQTIYLGGLH
jgi:3-oxoacyl-[acyl-carrier protein] reductase